MPTNKSKSIGFRLRNEEIEQLDSYVAEHGINRTQAIRIALKRLLTRKPTGKEVRESAREIGSPVLLEGGEAASKQGSRAAEIRHSQSE